MVRVPAAEQVQVNFRMPVDLRDRIRAAAEANKRSLNAEIIARLAESFDDSASVTRHDVQALVSAARALEVQFAERELALALSNHEKALASSAASDYARTTEAALDLAKHRLARALEAQGGEP